MGWPLKAERANCARAVTTQNLPNAKVLETKGPWSGRGASPGVARLFMIRIPPMRSSRTYLNKLNSAPAAAAAHDADERGSMLGLVTFGGGEASE